MWLASDQAPAGPSALMVVALVASTIFVLGYRIAVNRRANSDYKTAKAAVPKLRRGFWRTWWAAAKIVGWTALAVVLLMSWAIHDARELAGR